MDKCKYECGQVANFTLKNGAKCCSETATRCPKLREKNANALRKAYESGKRKSAKEIYNSLDQKTKEKMSSANRGKFNTDFSKDSKYKSGNKKFLLMERGNQCEVCNLIDWNGKPITLEIDHKDGNRRNNDKENLRLVCPNCHSQSPTWRRRKDSSNMPKKSDSEIIDAILKNKSMNATIEHLGLRWNSYSTILRVMKQYDIDLSIWS